MRILFTAYPLYGHVNPMLPLAKAARRAGHEVAFATGADMAAHLDRQGIAAGRAGARADRGDDAALGPLLRGQRRAARGRPRAVGAGVAPRPGRLRRVRPGRPGGRTAHRRPVHRPRAGGDGPHADLGAARAGHRGAARAARPPRRRRGGAQRALPRGDARAPASRRRARVAPGAPAAPGARAARARAKGCPRRSTPFPARGPSTSRSAPSSTSRPAFSRPRSPACGTCRTTSS